MCCTRFIQRCFKKSQSVEVPLLDDELNEKKVPHKLQDIEMGVKRVSPFKTERQKLKQKIRTLEKSQCLNKCNLTMWAIPPLMFTGVIGFSIYHYQSSVEHFHSFLDSFTREKSLFNNLTTCSIQYAKTYNFLDHHGFGTTTGNCEEPCDPGLYWYLRPGLLCDIPQEDSSCYKILYEICYGSGMFRGYGGIIITFGMLTPILCFLALLPYCFYQITHDARSLDVESKLQPLKEILHAIDAPLLAFCVSARSKPPLPKPPIANFFEHPTFDPNLIEEIADFLPFNSDASGMRRV